MKTFLPFLTCLALVPATAPALISSFGASGLSATIPDGDLSGYQSSFVVSGMPATITDINFSLNLVGGFNGDFYAYVTHGTNSAVLLNRTGRSSSSGAGYPDGGFAVTLDDQAPNDVHLYRSSSFTLSGGQLTGTWQPDSRAIDPLSSGGTFSSALRLAPLSVFNGMDPNGTWTFFIADVAAGSEGVLNSYSLQVTAVPEPGCIGLLGLGLGAGIWRRATSGTR